MFIVSVVGGFVFVSTFESYKNEQKQSSYKSFQMKRLLLPLLAGLALPTAVNAEVDNYYLLGMAARKSYVVPIQLLEAFEVVGQKFADAKAWFRRQETMTPLIYVCVKAK